MYRVHKVLYTECQSWPWPLTPWHKINRVPSIIIHNSHAKFESDWAKTVVCIMPTRSYTHSAEVDLNLWLRDPKSIGFLLSSSTTYMWSLKLIGQKLWSLSCPQGRVWRNHAHTHPRTHSLTQLPTNGRVTISLPMLLRGDNYSKDFHGRYLYSKLQPILRRRSARVTSLLHVNSLWLCI